MQVLVILSGQTKDYIKFGGRIGMRKFSTTKQKVLSIVLSLGMIVASTPSLTVTVQAAANKTSAQLSYKFTGADVNKAGYAEGTITLKSATGGTYYLYWADDKGALSGYYEITTMKLEKDGVGTFTFEYHTAIPADATKVIAIKSNVEPSTVSVSNADAVYNIPAKKQLPYLSKDAIYTFNSYSDIHIDEEKWGETPAYWWQHSEQHWAQALQYADDKKVDFIVSSGDQVTNASIANLDKEWKVYQYILSQSDYVNPIWESGGNHEVRQDGFIEQELSAYIKGSGVDNNADTINANKSYYTITEPKTGDLFIFMSLEAGYRPAQYDEFSDEQLEWLEEVLASNYNKGKNIYLIQHALVSKYGAGDDTENPYYGGSINPELKSAKKFISIIEKYPKIVWISGHTHEAYSLGYNYSNNNNTSCNMIHNSSIGNPTHISTGDTHALDYAFNEDLSQGYYVQTFKNAILFNGANVCDGKIYPQYSYIIDGNTSKSQINNEETYVLREEEVTSQMLNSIIANTNSVLGVYYEYSSYDQYQTLKKYYYKYKDIDTKKLTDEERKIAYSQLSTFIANLNNIVKATSVKSEVDSKVS